MSSYHPDFSSSEADVIIRSIEGTLYRVHSYTLRTTSGFFNAMFSLPQPKTFRPNLECGGSESGSQILDSTPNPSRNTLDVYEADITLEPLLRLICGLPIPPWKSLSELERLLSLAEKWDMPGPMTITRSALSSFRFLHEDPLRCYALARRYGWNEEAKLASTHTLGLDILDPIHASTIDQMTSKDLIPLLDLHRKRRDKFRDLINSSNLFGAGNSSGPYYCTRCGVTELDNYTWRDYKNALLLELDRCSLGDTVGIGMGDTAEWPEAQACWEAKCPKEGCDGLNYDRLATLRQIRVCVELLPFTIED
ncbi:hypothetical protein BYT27DRAFT_7110308 [Phlegmacium glaucopus]|nr:hypothetical protein BYT27DRAFT_7110308 [Phlegmacium glaucopus]